MKDQNVVEEDWDVLIVLDACRYDFFEEIYEDYFEGELEKRESRGSSTLEWAAKNFTGWHDITYFSSNPFINSLGIPLDQMEWGSSCDYDWKADDHLSRIFDVWETHWDDRLKTVPPLNVNQAVRENLDQEGEDNRVVVHYMQPHAPYIEEGKGRKVDRIRKSFESVKEEGGESSRLASALSERVKPRAESLAQKSELIMKIGMLVELNPASLVKLGKSGTREALEEYYEQNLRLALEAVQELVPELEGDVVITSDHGEAFGEEGIWEHRDDTHIPVLVRVPWFRLEEVK